MKTIRRFYNVARAGFTCSLLKSIGIDAALADEYAYTLGPQFVPWGIRLQVPEADADRATRVLDHQEGFSPLPDDFVPPPEPPEPPTTPANRKGTMIGAFLKGGLWALVALCVLAGVTLATGGRVHAGIGSAVRPFALGGVIGLILRAVNKQGRRDESTHDRNG